LYAVQTFQSVLIFSAEVEPELEDVSMQ